MMKTLSAVAVLASFLLAGADQAQAALSACSVFSPNVTDNVSNTSRCQIDPNIDNDNDSGPNPFLSVNWFGFDDWVRDSKDNDLDDVDEGDNTLGFSVSPVGGSDPRLSGTWSFSESLAGHDVMLVFKDGQQSNPNGLVSYLVSASSGAYESMFFNDNEEVQQISHVSVWKRGGGNGEIPVPATLMLLGLGLAGLGLGFRRT